jgi:hypothetical protein
MIQTITVRLPVDEHLQRVAGRVDGELRPLAGLQELLARVDVHAASMYIKVTNIIKKGNEHSELK